MTWVKVDDRFTEHPKTADLTLEAIGFWLYGVCYASKHRGITPGFIPEAAVTPNNDDSPFAAPGVDELVDVGLWRRCDGGYLIADSGFYELGSRQSERAAARKWRTEVLNRDGYVCGICGGSVEPDDVHIDHIVPIARGGISHPSNMQVTHATCNLRKGAR